MARDPFSVQKDPQRALMSGYPVLVGHHLSARLEPTNIHSAANRTPLEPATPAKHGVLASQPDQPARYPRQLVVLAVSIVVALLRPAELVTHEQHRHALREEKCGQTVALLLRAQPDDGGVVRLSLHATVPRAVVRFPVGVVLAVRFVVLLVVGHEVAQREAIVRSDEVDAGHGPA